MFLRCKQTGFFTKYFPFTKGDRSTFSLFERKSCKKKQTNVPFDRWCIWELHTAKPTRSARKRADGTRFA